MKWKFAAMFVSLAALAVACSSKSSGGAGGTGGEGGETTTTTGSGNTTSTGTGTGTGSSTGTGMGGAGGGGGAGGSGSACDNKGDCKTCQSCAQQGPCSQALADFQKTPNWMTFYQCVTPCQSKPMPGEQQTCAQACCTANPTECQAYQKIVTCVVCDSCYTDCMGAQAGCPAP